MRENFYQGMLILSLVAVTAAMGVFVYREVFPEYRVYQDIYVELEKFRAENNHSPPPPFKKEVKQIVMPSETGGPEEVDRCISCHVATQLSHFSPTRPALDINGHVDMDENGHPKKVSNEDYVWKKLDETIAELTDEKLNQHLINQGDSNKVRERLTKAENLKSLKTAKVGDKHYDMTKVLAMHPLMGQETRPFQFHPIEEYGCTVCHNGNGRGLVTDKAHGPLYSGSYEASDEGPHPDFTEIDPENDPLFSKIFNHKPGHELLFQTNPLFVGHLMQAKCVQCHQSSSQNLLKVSEAVSGISKKKSKDVEMLSQHIKQDEKAVKVLIELLFNVQQVGLLATEEQLRNQLRDLHLTEEEQEEIRARLKYIGKFTSQGINSEQLKEEALHEFNQELMSLIGSEEIVQDIVNQSLKQSKNKNWMEEFLEEHREDPRATGSLFSKIARLKSLNLNLQKIKKLDVNIQTDLSSSEVEKIVFSDLDKLTQGYHRGMELFISQACYACHRIDGFSRGGVGPELTREGLSYPWFVKESIVWPQADLKTSTMPNFRLDHEELEDLMTFLMAQRGKGKAISEVQYKINVKSWEEGEKLPWEKPIQPDRIHDLHYGMKVFATEGCASCHRLAGFESNIGYKVEKENPSFENLYKEKLWFKKLFPENILGSQLVKVLEEQGEEIDRRIINNVRKNSILENLEADDPDAIREFYTPFKYAARAKNQEYKEKTAKDPEHEQDYLAELNHWKDRVHRALMMFVQEYGLGRLIAPRVNWSGIFRSDEWLIGHFRNPSAYSARSIMPVFPFDDTKFYALTYMLNILGQRNRDSVRQIWEHRGFNPELAYQIHCSNCHGETLQGNGPTAEWIYPIPKNLRNANFLRNLTRERAIYSITHGVHGTPMPRWGEVASDKHFKDQTPILTRDEIEHLTDWIFHSLPGSHVIKQEEDILKWKYNPEDVLEELKKEGGTLKSNEGEEEKNVLGICQPKEIYYASLNPVVYASDSPIDVETLFDIKKNDQGNPEYYIKPKYYTSENIQEGQRLFIMHCSVCHGKEAAGNGERAQTMVEAKPRMLVNVDWLKTRDDLRLLRSVKYGVPGTAMTPWGDYTDTLQRLQMVIFIRSLSQERRLRDDLASALFTSFEQAVLQIAKARASQFEEVNQLKSEYASVQRENEESRNSLDSSSETDGFQRIQLLRSRLDKLESQDEILSQLIQLVNKEKEIYLNLGLNLIERHVDEALFHAYLNLIKTNDNRFLWKEGKLSFSFSPHKEDIFDKLKKDIVFQLDERIAQLSRQKEALLDTETSIERDERIARVEEEEKSLIKLKGKFLSGLSSATQQRQKQRASYEEYTWKHS